MTRVKIDISCIKDMFKREPIVKIVEELPDKDSADLNYIYIVPKDGEGKDKKAYVLRPDRSGYDTIDLTPQIVDVVGEGYITVEKETLNENGDVTFTVKTNETLANLLDSLGNKNEEQDGKLTNLTDRVTALESKTDKDTVYDDSELREQVNDLGSSMASALHDIGEIKVNNESRLSVLEKKPDNDKQTLSLEGNTLSISNGNSVELPTTVKPTKVTTDSEGVTVTHTETEEANTYNVNINGALENYYDKSKTYTKEEVNGIIVEQEAKATDITVYRGQFQDKNFVMEGDIDKDISPRITLTYSSSTGVGILKIDFKIMKAVSQGQTIAYLPTDAPRPVELIESQAWIGGVYTSIWINKDNRAIKILGTRDSEIFNKRIIINIPGIFKKE